MSPLGARRERSFGQDGESLVDRLGVYFSSRAILAALGGRSGLRALDLGCGYNAKLLRSLAPRLAAGCGVDVAIAPALKSMPGLFFIEGCIEEALPAFASASQDVIFLISVLEHLWEPLAALQACRRILAADGLLLINVPTWLGKRFLEFSAFRLATSPAAEMDDHKMYYDQRDLWPLIVRAGFLPSCIQMQYHKLGLNLFAVCRKELL